MYLKIIGSLFLLTSAASIGFLEAEELHIRVKTLMELKRMMVLLQGELRFKRASLPEAFENVAERVDKPFALFLREVSEKLEKRESGSFEAVWDKAGEKLLWQEGFQKEDKQFFEVLKSSLGYLDFTMQTETLNLAILQAEEAICAAKEQQEKKGRLYRTMGVTMGALLTLLMI